MSESCNSKYAGSFLVAIQVGQYEVHAADHETFKDANGLRQIKCPKCDAHYTIGYAMHYPAGNLFEALAEQLQRVLLTDHSNYRSHQLAIPLT